MSELIWHLAAGLAIIVFCGLGIYAIVRDGVDKVAPTGSRLSRVLKFSLLIGMIFLVGVGGVFLAYLGLANYGAFR